MTNIDRGKDVLTHYGVLGMKWGKRTKSEDYEKASSLKGKKLYEMSNDDIATLNKRMQLEKTYKELSKSYKKAGETETKKFMKNFGKQQLNIVGGMAVAFVVKQAINYGKSRIGMG